MGLVMCARVYAHVVISPIIRILTKDQNAVKEELCSISDKVVSSHGVWFAVVYLLGTTKYKLSCSIS